MSRFVNVLVPKKISDKDYQALRIFVSSNPKSWDKGTLDELENDWKNAEKEYLFLGVRVGANQDYEDVPYLKLDPNDPLATEFAYIQPGDPSKPITKADQIRKAFEQTIGEAAKGAGLELRATDYGGYGDEEAIQLISKSLELSALIEAPVHVKDEGVIPLGGIPRIFRKGRAEIDYGEVYKDVLSWVKRRDKMPDYFDRHMQRHKELLKQIAPAKQVEELYAKAEKEFESNRSYYKDEGFIENLISAIRADTKPIPRCSMCNKKFFSEATRESYVHNEFMAKDHARSTGHVFAPDYAHMPADIKKAPYYKDAKALAKKHSFGKGKELGALLEQMR